MRQLTGKSRVILSIFRSCFLTCAAGLCVSPASADMIPITVTTDYAASGDTLFVYRTGYVSPVTGRYREGESRDDGYRYTVRVDEGYKATVRIYYSDYIGENSSNRLMINGGGYAVGQTYLKTVYGGDTAHVELKSASNYTSDPGGSTLRCYFDISVTYETWEPEPDLAVESCTVTPDSLALVDEPKRLEFAIVNRGGGTAGPTVAVVYDGSSPLARFDIPSLPTKARTSRELDITGLRVGEHTLCVRVDAVPGELETSNNEKSASLRVHARKPYTVRFDANGGELTDDTINPVVVESKNCVSEEDAPKLKDRPGYNLNDVTWTDKATGTDKEIFLVIASGIRLLGSKKEAEL